MKSEHSQTSTTCARVGQSGAEISRGQRSQRNRRRLISCRKSSQHWRRIGRYSKGCKDSRGLAFCTEAMTADTTRNKFTAAGCIGLRVGKTKSFFYCNDTHYDKVPLYIVLILFLLVTILPPCVSRVFRAQSQTTERPLSEIKMAKILHSFEIHFPSKT